MKSSEIKTEFSFFFFFSWHRLSPVGYFISELFLKVCIFKIFGRNPLSRHCPVQSLLNYTAQYSTAQHREENCVIILLHVKYYNREG